MIDPNPAPTIPAIEADNAIDVDKLGSANLLTYIKYPGIENGDGDIIIPNFRGCAADGTVVDGLNSPVEVELDKLTPDGMPAEILNHVMTELKMGWGFYSYRVHLDGTPGPGEESQRIFFYVGKRPRPMWALPVLHIEASHDLHLDLSSAPAELKPVLAPYEAMADGDVVTLYCRRFHADGQEYLPALAHATVVTKADLGKPLKLDLSKSDVRRVDGGRIEVNYGIQYAGTAIEKTLSAMQTFQLLAPTTSQLAALTVVGHTPGEPINPAQFPRGLILRIGAYTDMGDGDVVLCSAVSEAIDVEPLTFSTRVDASTLGRGFMEFLVPAQWVKDSNGYPFNLTYQFAWIGTSMSATPYPATVREPLNLPMLIVVGAVPGDKPVEGEGEIEAARLVNTGVTLIIDDNANYGPNDTVEVYWAGFGNTGYYIAIAPTTPGGRTYTIPPEYIPANMGKSLPVYYCVTPDGDTTAIKSDVFTLRVLPVPKDQYRAIQSAQAQSTNGRISINLVPVQGEKFSFPQGWVFMRAGQILNAVLVGKDSTDQELTYPLFDNHVVTKPEADSKLVETYISKIELQKFKLGGVTVRVTIIYEPGAETSLTEARFTLEA